MHLPRFRSRVLMPHMRQVRTNEHNVAVDEWFDAVSHHPVSTTLDRQRELILGMKVPARAVVRPTHHLAVEGLPLALGHFFEDRLHGEVCDGLRWLAVVCDCSTIANDSKQLPTTANLFYTSSSLSLSPALRPRSLASMKASRSPSMTACTPLVFSPVRWSLTIW